MKQIVSYSIAFIILSFACSIHKEAKAQFNYETGFYPRIHFSPKDYDNASPQNWDIEQDKRGIMFFANDEGVLEYDGIEWRLERVSNESPVKSIEIDKYGRVYVGAVGEFGYLAPNKPGDLKYFSLSKNLPDSLQEFSAVWYIHTIGENVFFQAKEYIFKWNGDTLTHFQPRYLFHTSFKIDNAIIVNEPAVGLFLLKNGEYLPIKGDRFPKNSTLFSLMPFRDNKYLVVAGMKGFYEVSLDKSQKNWSLKIEKHVLDQSVDSYFLYNVARAGKNTFSIGTWNDGLLLLRNNDLQQRVTKKTGLTDENVLAQYYDKDGNLWVALSNGITKLEISSPFTHFTNQIGVDGVVESITRWNGLLYIATDRGIGYLPDYQLEKNEIYTQNHFRTFASFQGGALDVINFQHQNSNVLIVAENTGVVQFRSKNQMKKLLKSDAYCVYQPVKHSGKLFVGNGDGMVMMSHNAGNWKVEEKFPAVKSLINNFCEDEKGNIYAGSGGNGIFKIYFDDIDEHGKYKVLHFDSTRGMPVNSPAYLSYFNGDVLVGTDQGLYKVNKKGDSLILAENYPDVLTASNRLIHRLKADSNRLWITSFIDLKELVIGYVEKQNKELSWVKTPFKTISEGIIHSFFPDEKQIVWMGGTEGLYRYDPKVEKNYKKDYAALIRMNIIGKDSTIFFGSYYDDQGRISTIQPEVLKPDLPYRLNTLEFHFAAQNTGIKHPLQFSYKLEGYDNNWSEWSVETKRYYTNLPEGDYKFRVKVKNIYDHESREALYEFSIAPPWYRTIWAYILYVLLFVFIVYIIVKEYTKYLREIIRQKTAEIRNQKEIVERKNKEITDSIKYAQRIQEAMLPPRKILDDAQTDYFILFKPRDIVSGDFYWFRQIGEYQVIVAADCTGHGVPGAFVSMLGMAFLNEIAAKIETVSAHEILNKLRDYVIKSLRQGEEDSESKDGMDLALYVVDKKNMKVQFAGANNPLVIIRNGEIIQIKGNRMPIGQHIKMKPFESTDVVVQKGDMLYTFSDGYQDQFGGEKNSKFKIKRMKQLMAELYTKPVEEQHQIFDQTIEDWMSEESQIDDILLIGIRM